MCTFINMNAFLLLLEHFKTFPEKKSSRPIYGTKLRSSTLKNLLLRMNNFD